MSVPIRKDGKPWNRGNFLYAERMRQRAALKRANSAAGEHSKAPKERKEDVYSIDAAEFFGAGSKESTSAPQQVSGSSAVVDMDVVDEAGTSQIQGRTSTTPAVTVSPKGGGGGPSGSTSRTGDTIIMNPPLTGGNYITIRHTHLFQSWGIKYKLFEFKMSDTTKSSAKDVGMLTSLSRLPVEALWFYMSPAEYKSLPPGSSVKSVGVRVIPKGVRVSFDVGTTVASTANNTHVVFLQTALGLGSKFLQVVRKPVHNATKPMEIDSVGDFGNEDLDDFQRRMWGINDVDGEAFKTNIPTCLGGIRAIPWYTVFVHPDVQGTDKKMSGWPILTRHCSIMNAMSVVDIPVIEYSYKPMFNVLHAKKSFVPKSDKLLSSSYPYTFHQPWATACAIYNASKSDDNQTTVKIKPGSMSEVFSRFPGTRDNHDNAYEYVMPIEMANYCRGINNSFNVVMQPSCHIGILPVQSNAPSDVASDFVNACCIYQVETEIVVECNYDAHYANNSYYLAEDLVFQSFSVDVANMYGKVNIGHNVTV